MRCRIPIIYLVDSSGVNLPYQGGVFPGPVRREPVVLLQLDHAPIPAHSAARRGDGTVHRRRRVSAGALRPHRHGQGHVVHGARRSESREGRHRPDDRRRDARRRGRRTRRSAASRTTRPTTTTRASRSCAISSRMLPPPQRSAVCATASTTARRRSPPEALYDLLPADHRMSYDMHQLLARDRRRRQDRRIPGRSRAEMICGDARIDGHSGRRHRQSARPDQGARRREAALRRHRLRRERREGRVLHRPLRSRANSAAVRSGRLRLHGRPRGRARRNHSRRRALRRSDGDGARAEDRAHRESRVGRRLLRDGGAGLRSRFHLQLADGTHGGDGRRGRGAGGARSGDRSRQGRRSSRSPPAVAESMDEMRADYEHQLDARYAGARGFIDAIVYPEETRDVLALALARGAAESRAASRCRSFSPHTSTTYEHHERQAASFASRRARASGATGSRRRAARSRAATSTT